jgi:hypothetical protein
VIVGRKIPCVRATVIPPIQFLGGSLHKLRAIRSRFLKLKHPLCHWPMRLGKGFSPRQNGIRRYAASERRGGQRTCQRSSANSSMFRAFFRVRQPFPPFFYSPYHSCTRGLRATPLIYH